MVQKSTNLKRVANKIADSFKEQGYKLVKVTENPKNMIGKWNIKKYTVIALNKTRKRK